MRGRANPKLLSRLLADFAFVDASDDVMISGISDDSRQVRPGDLFLALRGAHCHGSQFIAQALDAGARAIAVEVGAEQRLGAEFAACRERGVGLFPILGLGRKAGIIAARFHDHPSETLQVIGITGTNGKTSCSQFLAQCLHHKGRRCAVIGTLGYGFLGALHPIGHTTPMGPALQAILAGLRDAGAGSVAMEVSSHALAQGRVEGVCFELAVLTNLSQDHLDYHGDMSRYAEAKKRLFRMPGLARAVLNLDDALGRELAAELAGGETEVLGYSLTGQQAMNGAVVQGEDLRLTPEGMRLRVCSPWGGGELSSALLGRFNAANLLAVLTSLLGLGWPLEQALSRLSRVEAPPGRLERLPPRAGKPTVVIDYAHTPDALEQVLHTLRGHCRGELWLVFGCGGERDRGKRAQMGRVAEAGADHIVLTDDNPRAEPPQAIVTDILAGIADTAKVDCEHDRSRAIALAIGRAGADDVVLIAGKGHEQYQLVAGRRLPFSDRAMAEKYLGVAA